MEDGSKDGRFPMTDGAGAASEVGASAALSEEWAISFLLLCVKSSGSCDRELREAIGRMGGLRGDGSRRLRRLLWEMEDEGLVSIRRGERRPEREDSRDSEAPWEWYEITGPGEAYLEFWAGVLEDYTQAAELFLRTYGDGDGRGLSRRARGEGRV